MDTLKAMEELGNYFNEGDGVNADEQTQEAWHRLRDFVMAVLMMQLANHA